MTSIRLRTAISAAALLWLAAGCAHRSGPRNPAAVSREDIEQQQGESIEKVLQSKAPGLIVSRTPDGGIAVRIRGASSVYGSNEPLYVIDDNPIAAGPGGALVGVNPHDIDSIRVLKDPADTGVYGARGANGVILITTKKPGKRP